jgi:hypothetical protein
LGDWVSESLDKKYEKVRYPAAKQSAAKFRLYSHPKPYRNTSCCGHCGTNILLEALRERVGLSS